MLRFPKLEIIFIFAVFNSLCIASVKTGFISSIKGYETNDSLPDKLRAATLTATINPSVLNVCQNDPGYFLTFTGSGGTAPYTFKYKINGVSDLTIQTASGSNNVILIVPSNVVGSFTYSLVSVSDPSNSAQSQTGTATVIVSVKPDATLNSSGDLINFNGYSTFTTCSSSSTEVTFTNASTTISTNLGYEISWGDGSPNFSGTTWNLLSHNYAIGFWDLTYTVTGSNGCQVTEMYKIFVGSNPAVSLGSPGNTNICANESLTFPITGTESNPQGTTYTVIFNDGSAPQVFNHPPPSTVDHTFLLSSCGTTSFNGPISFPNSFSVNILASNPCGKSAVSVVPIYVSKQPIASFLSSDTIACTNTPVCLDNTSTGASLASATGCDKGYKIIWVISPSAGVTLNSGTLGNDFGSVNQNVWISGSDIICPVFSLPGNYTITIKVANYCGIAMSVKNICVEAPLSPQFNLNATAGCAPLAITATNTTNYANSCSSPVYLWEVDYVASNCGTSPAYTFTNGTSTSASPSFEFTNTGTYKLKLSVTNSCGTDSTTQTITVKKPPTITIADISTLCQTFPVTVINPSATVVNCGVNPLNYQWSFPGGDPATSAVLNPGPIKYSLPGSYSVTLAVTNECGTTTVTGNSFTINATPTVNDIDNQAKCKDQLSDAIVFQGSVPGTVYNWTNDNTSFGLAASGTGNINPFILPNAGTELLTATITVTPVLIATACTGASKTFQISVHPEPIVNDLTDRILCNNDGFTGINVSSPVLLTTFTWVNSNTSIGLGANGSGNIPGFTAINTGTTPQFATITVTPWNVLGCSGASKTVVLTVNPTPALLLLADKEFCNGVVTSPVTFSNAVSGTTYAWINSNTSIGLAGSGMGNIPSFTPVNNGTDPISATITVFPSANGCLGSPEAFTVTVNPSPVITFSPGNQSLCSEDNSVLVTLSSTTPGVTFNWTAAAPAGITGVTTSGTSTIPVQTLVNSTNMALDVIYNASALVNGNVSCAGAVFNYTIRVNPKPLVSSSLLSTICSEGTFTVNPANGSGNVIPVGISYTWGAPTISPPAALTGTSAQSTPQTSISQTLTNSTFTAATATYSVTPTTLNACSGPAFNVIVTVNPKPTVHAVSNIIVCSGELITQQVFSGDVSGSIYNWTNNDTSIGLVASGTGPIPAFTAVNTTALPVIATITITPIADGCVGLSKTFTITVNPIPTVNPIADVNLCNNESASAISFTGNIAGASYSWVNDTPTIGLSASGNGNIPVFTAINNGTTAVTAIITITPTAGGCTGSTSSFSITVHPTPTIAPPLSQEVCNGLQTAAIIFNGAVANTIYSWTNNTTSIGLAANGTGDILPFATVNNGTNAVTATITVTPQVNGCSGTPETFTIQVNPSPIVVFSPGNQSICSGSQTVEVNLSSTTSGATFTWTAVQPAGITGVQTSGTSQIPVQVLLNSTNIPIVVSYSAVILSNSATNCFGNAYEYTITVNPEPSVISLQEDSICSKNAFTVNPQDGNGNTVPANTLYTWNEPVINPAGAITGGSAQNIPQSVISQTLTNITDNVATARYSVTPSGDCPGLAFDVVVTVYPSPKVQFSEPNQIICSGETSLPVILSSVTTGNITYNWVADIPSGISGATATGTGAIDVQTLVNSTSNPLTVTYTATATLNDGISCPGMPSDYTITVNPGLITSSILSNYNGFNISISGSNDGWIDLTVTGSSGVYSYLWSGPNGFTASTQDISNLFTGAYTLSLSDGICDPIILNFILIDPVEILIQEDLSSHVNMLCNGDSTGVIRIDITQPSLAPYDYVLTRQNGDVVENVQNISDIQYSFTGLTAGTYNITVTDATGNFKTISGMIITESDLISVTINAQLNVTCPGGNNGSASATASGGTGTLSYSWSTIPEQTTATATGLAAGIYSATVTDANGCSVSIPVNITEPAEIITSVSFQTDILCFGESTGSVAVTASGGTGVLSYLWNTIPVQNTPVASGLAAGTYLVTVTDANSCSKVQTVTLTQPAESLISSITSSNNVSCFGANDGNASVLARGGTAPYSYLWNTVPVQTTASAIDLVAGNYVVTVTDAKDCVSTSSIFITEPTQIMAFISAQTNVICSGNNTGSATVTASGGVGALSYLWNTVPAQISPTATGLATGDYAVTVTDANNCTVLIPVTITEPNAIITSISTQTNVPCFGESTGSATVAGSGGIGTLSYSWNTIPVQSTPTATGLIAGTYQVTVTDANACFKIQEVVITQPDEIVISTENKKDVTCAGSSNGEINILVTGGSGAYSYSWTKNNISFATTQDLSGIGPGVYVVLVSDANGCGPKSATFSVSEPPVLVVSLISKTNIICYGEATGAITVGVTGGTALEVLPGVFDYLYAWTGSNGYTNTGRDLTNIPAGTYQLTVTDALGCTNQLTVIITQPAELVINYTTTPVICYGSNNASITLTVSGGVTPYQIQWSNLGTGLLQQDLAAGVYVVTVTDAIGCQKVVSVDIPEAPVFTINPVVKNVSCFGAKDGSITLNFRGGVPPVTLAWSDGSPEGTARNNLGPGTYSVTIRDGAPCSILKTFVILEPQQLVLSANITNAFDCNTANSGTINLIVAGGTPPMTYVWSNGASTEDLIDIPAGNYLVTVTDSVGCVQTAQYAIQRQTPLAVAVATTIDFNCVSKQVTEICTAQISGGVSPYVLTWTGGGTVSGTYNQIMETTQNGLVILSVTDALGCSATYAFNVEIPANGIESLLMDCGKRIYQFNTIAINPQSMASYNWDFGDGTNSTLMNPKHTYVTSGTYKVLLTVTGASCTYSYNETIVVEAAPVLLLEPEPKFCKGDSIQVFMTGAQTYQWYDGSVGNSNWIKQSGDFIVTGTSKSGCISTLNFTATYNDLLNYTIQTDRNEVSADEPTLHVWSETTSPSQYFWDFGDGEESQGNDLNHTYAVAGEGFYDINLKVINPGGCVELATKRIWIVNSSLPNTLTPNGDGINDVFMKDWHIQVYNRNGILLYEGIDGWDGTYKGEKVTNDTYFYVLYFVAESGTQTRAGYITVIR